LNTNTVSVMNIMEKGYPCRKKKKSRYASLLITKHTFIV
jgi:hypothetical protein